MKRTNRRTLSLACLLVLGAVVTLARGTTAGPASASANPPDPNQAGTATQETTGQDTLTRGFWGLSDELAGHGIEVTAGATSVYQTNARGGLGTHQKSGRLTGSYDVEIATDFEKLSGVRGLGLFLHGWGGWPATQGINEAMVGSAFNVNWDAIGHRTLDLVEVILEWSPFDGPLTIQIGKINFANVFDTSEYANDETSQFLNGAFVNNPTIPIPDYCLGGIVSAKVTDSLSLAAGVADAEADGRTTGFRTAFDGDDYFFYTLEAGIRSELRSPQGSLAGNYRFGLWYDARPNACSGSEHTYHDNAGIYTSVDQVLIKENDDPEDSQGLGVFARYGSVDEKQNDISDFWSAGLQYQGLFPRHDGDVLAVGFAQGVFSNDASELFTADHESVLELYYNASLTPWIGVTPSIQYISHPGGNREVDSAVVVGVRAQVSF